MDNYIKAYSIGEAWLLSLKQIIAHGTEIMDDKGPILEMVPLCIEITHPSLSDKIIEKYGDQKYLHFLSANFSDPSPILDWGYSYAQRLYSYNNTNQIESIINKLRRSPLSKSATISLLNDEKDIAHTPCLTTLDFKVRNETLIINAMFRSQDIGKKMYGDALELLKIGNHIMQDVKAQKIAIIHSISSAHIYVNDLQLIHFIIDDI